MKKLLTIIVVMLFSLEGWSQRELITFSFNAKDSLTQSPLIFDSINVYNVDLDCDTTLYNGVSELTVDVTLVGLEGITFNPSASFTVMQNTPNPFQGKTMVKIYLKNRGTLHLEVYDNIGNKLSVLTNEFGIGWHQFAVSTKASQQLFLRVFDNSVSKTIKIMSVAPGAGEDKISYDGNITDVNENLKSIKGETGFIFYLGNLLRFTAFIEGYHENVRYANPVNSESYLFAMLPLTTITIPTVFTSPITEITQISAIGGGEVVSDGGGTVTGRGVCWSTIENPTIADNHTSDGIGTGTFISSIAGLSMNTTYYIRAYATNSIGTSYGNEVSFTSTETVTDIDGNVYTTVVIGSQKWMVENLKVTHYVNGDPIPNITYFVEWANLNTGAYVWFNNDEAGYGDIYGALYNWYTVVDSRKLCPTGWHTPRDEEWTMLTEYLGGESIAGGKMKGTGTIYWHVPNTGATNESGFTGLPGGYRDFYGMFYWTGYGGTWWSDTEDTVEHVWYRGLNYDDDNVNRNNNNKREGFSVRCVKD
jgi:uncharacterized protein (TIGR02145 family)